MMTQVIQKEALPKKISASFKNKEKQWKNKSGQALASRFLKRSCSNQD
jgi:hypothetical protein